MKMQFNILKNSTAGTLYINNFSSLGSIIIMIKIRIIITNRFLKMKITRYISVKS